MVGDIHFRSSFWQTNIKNQSFEGPNEGRNNPESIELKEFNAKNQAQTGSPDAPVSAPISSPEDSYLKKIQEHMNRAY